jgi:hypothetical protein
MTLRWEQTEDAAYAYAGQHLVGKVERDADLLWLCYDLRPEATEDSFAVCKNQLAAVWRVEERLQSKMPLRKRRAA